MSPLCRFVHPFSSGFLCLRGASVPCLWFCEFPFPFSSPDGLSGEIPPFLRPIRFFAQSLCSRPYYEKLLRFSAQRLHTVFFPHPRPSPFLFFSRSLLRSSPVSLFYVFLSSVISLGGHLLALKGPKSGGPRSFLSFALLYTLLLFLQACPFSLSLFVFFLACQPFFHFGVPV